MTTFFSPLLRRACFCLFLLCAGLGSGAAWCAENERAAESSTTLAGIQSFTSKASDLVVQAMTMIGTHYRWGGDSPETGLDCSGLVRYVFKEAWGANLPRTSVEISRVGTKVDPEELQPGDLVFYNTLRRGFSHVGIYLGDNKFIHAPSRGGQVRVDSMDLSYWKNRFNGARRILSPDQEKAETAEIIKTLQAEAAQAKEAKTESRP